MAFLPHLSQQAWLLVAFSAFCIGFTKAGFGGFGLIAVLVMALAFPAKESTGAVLPMLIMADFMAISVYRRHVS
ncbi:MAG: sulfite exporter TauE/SafE family protein, partial [Verrucomicrobiota bacterium]